MRKKNSAIISGMVLGTLTICPMTGWSQTSTGTSGSSGSAAESPSGRSSMDSMKHSSASGHWSSADVKSVQEALKNKGHDPGPIDGVMGARTQQALRSFQRAQNIQTSGQLDSGTTSALGVTLSAASGSSTGSVGSGTSTPPSKGTAIDPNEGNPKDRGAVKSGTPGSGSSSGAGSKSTPPSKSTTIDPNDGNPKDRGGVKPDGSSTGGPSTGSSGK